MQTAAASLRRPSPVMVSNSANDVIDSHPIHHLRNPLKLRRHSRHARYSLQRRANATIYSQCAHSDWVIDHQLVDQVF